MHVVGNDAICGQLFSPAELSIQDLQGKKVGVVNGEVHNDFPFGVVDKQDKFAKVLLAGNKDDYTYKVVGTNNGTYGLDITVRSGDQNLVFHARAIPTSPGMTHVYSVNTEALLQGRNDAVTIKIDTDGRGTYKIITAGKNLNGKDFNSKLSDASFAVASSSSPAISNVVQSSTTVIQNDAQASTSTSSTTPEN
jgi:hypothetical protein